jgi:hypothetical protein
MDALAIVVVWRCGDGGYPAGIKGVVCGKMCVVVVFTCHASPFRLWDGGVKAVVETVVVDSPDLLIMSGGGRTLPW